MPTLAPAPCAGAGRDRAASRSRRKAASPLVVHAHPVDHRPVFKPEQPRLGIALLRTRRDRPEFERAEPKPQQPACRDVASLSNPAASPIGLRSGKPQDSVQSPAPGRPAVPPGPPGPTARPASARRCARSGSMPAQEPAARQRRVASWGSCSQGSVVNACRSGGLASVRAAFPEWFGHVGPTLPRNLLPVSPAPAPAMRVARPPGRAQGWPVPATPHRHGSGVRA